ncbi:MAG: hypothetical protein QXZ09_08440, partial [Candidatus Methanomethylicaceae archaeon]
SRFSDTTLNAFINSALDRVALYFGAVDGWWLYAVPAAAASIDLSAPTSSSHSPAQMLQPKQCVFTFTGQTISHPVLPVTHEELLLNSDYLAAPTMSGTPRYIVFEQRGGARYRALIWPVPQDAGQLYIIGSAYPESMNADNEEPELRLKWREMVEHLILEQCYTKVGRHDLAERELAKFNSKYGRLGLYDTPAEQSYDSIGAAYPFGHV